YVEFKTWPRLSWRVELQNGNGSRVFRERVFYTGVRDAATVAQISRRDLAHETSVNIRIRRPLG
ncbi:MAG: hypothetical protein ACXWVO_12155, partial [Caulobacteraceae bacterium]